jgi:hypothetical protein
VRPNRSLHYWLLPIPSSNSNSGRAPSTCFHTASVDLCPLHGARAEDDRCPAFDPARRALVGCGAVIQVQISVAEIRPFALHVRGFRSALPNLRAGDSWLKAGLATKLMTAQRRLSAERGGFTTRQDKAERKRMPIPLRIRSAAAEPLLRRVGHGRVHAHERPFGVPKLSRAVAPRHHLRLVHHRHFIF